MSNPLNNIALVTTSSRHLTEEQKGKLQKATREFESMFVQMMLKSMRGAEDEKSDEFGGESYGGGTMKGLFDMELSKQVGSQGKLGIAQSLYRKLTGEDLPGIGASSVHSGSPAEAQLASKKKNAGATVSSADFMANRSIQQLTGSFDETNSETDEFAPVLSLSSTMERLQAASLRSVKTVRRAEPLPAHATLSNQTWAALPVVVGVQEQSLAPSTVLRAVQEQASIPSTVLGAVQEQASIPSTVLGVVQEQALAASSVLGAGSAAWTTTTIQAAEIALPPSPQKELPAKAALTASAGLIEQVSTPDASATVRTRSATVANAAIDRVKSYDAIITETADTVGVDANLLRAMIVEESGAKQHARSPKNAKGLMQLIDTTAASMGVKDVWDPHQNIEGGARYLKQQLEKFSGNVSLALASYNAGPGNVDRYNGIPPFRETQNYVKRVMKMFTAFQRMERNTDDIIK